MSNGTLDCRWFKVEKSREKFQRVIDNFAGEEPSDLIDQLLKLLEDKERYFEAIGFKPILEFGVFTLSTRTIN